MEFLKQIDYHPVSTHVQTDYLIFLFNFLLTFLFLWWRRCAWHHSLTLKEILHILNTLAHSTLTHRRRWAINNFALFNFFLNFLYGSYHWFLFGCRYKFLNSYLAGCFWDCFWLFNRLELSWHCWFLWGSLCNSLHWASIIIRRWSLKDDSFSLFHPIYNLQLQLSQRLPFLLKLLELF